MPVVIDPISFVHMALRGHCMTVAGRVHTALSLAEKGPFQPLALIIKHPGFGRRRGQQGKSQETLWQHGWETGTHKWTSKCSKCLAANSKQARLYYQMEMGVGHASYNGF